MQIVHFTPPQLAPLFGVNVSTIKRWVDRGFVPSEKTPGGHRRISQEHLNRFIILNPRYARRSYVLRRLLQQKKIRHLPLDAYYCSLLKNDSRRALRFVETAYLQGTPLIAILTELIVPALQRIGDEWGDQNLSIYQEHRMSFTIRQHLLQLDQFIPEVRRRDAPIALLACAPREYHEIPLKLIALIFKSHGWISHILGINIPAGELVRAAHELKPRIIGITRTYSRDRAPTYFKKVATFADQQGICLAIGGAAWSQQIKNPSRTSWLRKKCVHFFKTLEELNEYISRYQPRKNNWKLRSI